MVGEVPPYSMKSGPWELVGGEWTEVPTVLVVMMGGSRIGVCVDTRVDAMNPAKQQGMSVNAPTMATVMILGWGTGAIGM